jgi:Flp pilus assembly protein TadD
LLDHADGPGRRAFYLLGLGQLLEKQDDYAGALDVYAGALPLEPADPRTWYLINNNLGYCLNHFGRHAEAEAHCRRATEIDPARHNAYKNLGIALEGQGQFAEAARNYRRAADLCPADARAARHLEALLVTHPEAVAGLSAQ